MLWRLSVLPGNSRRWARKRHGNSPESAAEKAGIVRIEDLRLKTAVFGEIIFTQRIEIQSLMVDSKGGKVTLSGFAISGLTADSASKAASKIPGVKDVVNEIQVMPPVTVG